MDDWKAGYLADGMVEQMNSVNVRNEGDLYR